MAEQPRKTGVYESGSTTTAKRKGVPTWVWGLVALAILGLAALWYANQPEDDGPPPTGQSTTTTPPVTGPATPGAPSRPAQ